MFPSGTALTVDLGFEKRYPKAYPTVPDSPVDERAWEGGELHEVGLEGRSFQSL